MRKTTTLGASLMALVAGAWIAGAQAQTPPDQSPPAQDTSPSAPSSATNPSETGDKTPMKKPMHHSSKMSGKLAPTKAGDKAVEDLNDASLDAAKSGKPFNPNTVPTPAAAKKDAHYGSGKSMHHKMAKKSMKSDDTSKDSTAPAGDTAAPPADSSK